MREIRYREALREAIAEEMERDDRVFLMGEEVGRYQGAYKVTEGLFERFRRSILVMSYSSNGFPDLGVLVAAMKRHKPRIEVHERDHRYHFGTHDRVRRAAVREYVIVGR